MQLLAGSRSINMGTFANLEASNTRPILSTASMQDASFAEQLKMLAHSGILCARDENASGDNLLICCQNWPSDSSGTILYVKPKFSESLFGIAA